MVLVEFDVFVDLSANASEIEIVIADFRRKLTVTLEVIDIRNRVRLIDCILSYRRYRRIPLYYLHFS